MNPGKKIDALPRSANLRVGPGYAPRDPTTHFQFPDDGGSFARATVRCVGVGACRRHEGGTMCPSYMVTREERHSTRGRAHLLFEMLKGQPIADHWKSDAVKESLDLCLACKGCKGECPVHVDLATYKAEFLSHYYESKRRPRHAYAFALVHRWADMAAKMPRVANFVTQSPLLTRLAKWGANIAPQRRLPRVAPRTFTEWFRRRPASSTAVDRDHRVMLWPDTFNDHFFPGTLAATVEVLESVGCEVVIPSEPLCCGRPLYDFGMLDRAKRQLRQILDALGAELATGTPLIGVEASCLSVFRDELVNLFPHDGGARRLRSQVRSVDEYLAERIEAGATLPRLDRPVLVHLHCHHKAIVKTTSVERTLEAMGATYTILDDGCCGMAGAFGFERDTYDVSIAVGERSLLPAVRAADSRTIVIGDGFSCREQIAQTTDRRGLHLAEAVQLALHPEALNGDRLPEAASLSLAPLELVLPPPR